MKRARFGFKNFRDDNVFQVELAAVRAEWLKRFRVLVSIDGPDTSYEGLRFARILADNEDYDIILLYVRPIDQGFRKGGLQVRVVRENILDWGSVFPGNTHLKRGLDMLVSEEEMAVHWNAAVTHTDTWGDPFGDNKVEYRHMSGKSIVLKLKMVPNPASGILDQYELGS